MGRGGGGVEGRSREEIGGEEGRESVVDMQNN